MKVLTVTTGGVLVVSTMFDAARLKSTARNVARLFVMIRWSRPSKRISSSVTPSGLPFASTAVVLTVSVPF